MFSLSPSLYSLCPVSLSFSSLTRQTLSRKVPPCKPGPAQGFFLLKGSFFLCHCAYPGVLALGFWLCKAPRNYSIVNGAIQINWKKEKKKKRKQDRQSKPQANGFSSVLASLSNKELYDLDVFLWTHQWLIYNNILYIIYMQCP